MPTHQPKLDVPCELIVYLAGLLHTNTNAADIAARSILTAFNQAVSCWPGSTTAGMSKASGTDSICPGHRLPLPRRGHIDAAAQAPDLVEVMTAAVSVSLPRQ